jgi:hypothetical protein
MKVPAFVAALVAAVALALAGVAGADPGPNGHNDYGLCKAYFAGSDNGQDQKRSAPPFAALEEAAGGTEEDVAEFCESVTPGGK